jgi:hypothetical protein
VRIPHLISETRLKSLSAVTVYFLVTWTSAFCYAQTCATLLARSRHHQDYPIELYYPNEHVTPGFVNVGSKAYALWRQNSPHLPPSAFNYHYYSKEQAQEAGGWGRMKPIGLNGVLISEAVPREAVPFAETILKEARGNGMEYKYGFKQTSPAKLAAHLHGSVEKMFRNAGVDPRMSKRKIEETTRQGSGELTRFFIDANGDTYAITFAENTRIMNALGYPYHLHHAELAHLLFGDAITTRNIIDLGTLYSNERGELSATSYNEYLPKETKSVLHYLQRF